MVPRKDYDDYSKFINDSFLSRKYVFNFKPHSGSIEILKQMKFDKLYQSGA